MTEDKHKINTKSLFTEYLNANKLRKTPERFAILDMIMTKNGHFDSDSLYNDMESGAYHVSRATVYNTLELLCDCGVIRKLMFSNHQAHYERVVRGVNHQHLICTVCGKVKDAKDNDLVAFMNTRRYSSFTMEYFSQYIYGICNACARKKRKVSDANKVKRSKNNLK